jgi:hypothetical protein
MKLTGQNRQQWLAIAAGAVVALFALDKFVVTPLTRSWRQRNEAIAQLEKSITAGRLALDREQVTQRRWNDMRKNTLPANASQAEQEVLRAFDKWSQESRISVSSIKPQWKRGATDEYSVLECRVDAAGTLSTLTRFLYEVERSPMALRIESVEITARDSSGSQLALGLSVSGLRLTPLEGRQ